MIPRAQITDKGYQAPTREEVSAGLWQMFKDAFGQDLNTDERTPQGQLVTSLTAAFMDRDAAFIELSNNFDPRYSIGVWQDALGALYFMERQQATHSVAQLEFTGVEGAIIPVGTRLLDDNNIEWVTTQAGTIANNGTAMIWVRCSDVGAVSATIGSINRIVDNLTDVDRVENLTPPALGSLEESQFDFEARRNTTVAANSKNMNSSVWGAVALLDGVIDVRVVDNPTDKAITVGSTNYPVIRNGLLVIVLGGDDYAIAGTVLEKGGTGCAFVGNTEVTWFDDELWHDGFPPSYQVKFLRPSIIPLYFDVKVVDRNSVTSDQVIALKKTIIDQLGTGDNRGKIGQRIIPSSFICGQDRDLGIVKILASKDNVNWSEMIEYGIDEMPASDESMIEVTQL